MIARSCKGRLTEAGFFSGNSVKSDATSGTNDQAIDNRSSKEAILEG
jgi:hypothetical protein